MATDVTSQTLVHTARAVFAVCEVQPDERVLLLADEATDAANLTAFRGVAAESVADPALLVLRPRQPSFDDLPAHSVDALLAAQLVVDLTTVPWMYSDSFTRFAGACAASGTRLAFVWGATESIPTLVACPPSVELAGRARTALAALDEARSLRVRSSLGSDFAVELGDPGEYPRSFIGEPPVAPGAIAAPCCASVTAPFVPGTARGTLVFAGAGRYQAPENRPIRVSDPREPITLRFDEGRVVAIEGNSPEARELVAWFARAGHDDVYRAMDCNLGLDPRGDLMTADNTVVHSFGGGFMIGIGCPYEYRPEGSRKPGYHLDLMMPGVDVDLEERAFVRDGRIAPTHPEKSGCTEY